MDKSSSLFSYGPDEEPLLDFVGEGHGEKFQRKKKHYCCCLIVSLVIIFSFLLIAGGVGVYGYFVYAPDVIERATVSFDSVMLTDPSGLNSVGLIGKVSMDIQSGVSVDINIIESPFKLKFEGKVIGQFNIPASTISMEGKTSIDVSSTLDIEDFNQFNSFAQAMIFNDTAIWTIEGSITAKVGFVELSMPLSKDIALPGVGGFDDLDILQFDFTKSNETHIVVYGLSTLYNPSIVAISPLGDLTLDLYYKQSFLGSVSASNVSVYPGPNNLTLIGIFNPEDLDLASELVNFHLSGKAVNISATGSKVTSTLPLYNEVLNGLKVDTTLDGNKTDLVKSLNVKRMYMSPVNASSVKVEASVTCELVNPLGEKCPFTVRSVSFDADILTKDRIKIGSIKTDEMVATAYNNTISIELNTYIDVYGNGEHLADYLLEFINNEFVTIIFSRYLSGKIDTVIGTLNVVDFEIEVPAELLGMTGLPDVDIVSYDIPGDAGDGVEIAIEAIIHNPSSISVNLGNAFLEMLFDDSVLGTLYSENLSIDLGANDVKMNGVVKPEDMVKASRFFAMFLNGETSDVAVRGIGTDLNVTWINNAMSRLTLGTSLPGSHDSLINAVDIRSINLDFLSEPDTPRCSGYIGAHLNMPFGFTYSVHNITMDAILKNEDDPVVNINIPAQGVTKDNDFFFMKFEDLPLVILDEDMFPPFANKIFFNKKVFIQVEGTVTAYVETPMGVIYLPNLHLKNTAQTDGMDNLQQVGIQSFDLPYNSQRGGLAVLLNCTIYNPSQLSAQIGATEFEILYGGERMGFVSSPTLALNSGLNEYTLEGNINPDAGSVDQLSEFVSKFVNGESIFAGVRGYNTTTSYLNPTLRHLTLETSIDGLSNFNLIKELVINEMFINLKDKQPYVRGDFLGTINMPFGFPFEIIEGNISISMVLQDKTLCVITAFDNEVSMPSPDQMRIKFDYAPMEIVDEEQFSIFLDTVLSKERETVSIAGRTTANVVTNMDIPFFTLNDIDFTTSIVITGANNFKSPPVVVRGLDVTGSHVKDTVDLIVDITITNPSEASFSLGRIKLDIYYQNTYIGYGIAHDLSLDTGPNNMTVTGRVFKTDDNNYLISQFISNYLQGKASPAILSGNTETDIYVLKRALGNMAVGVTMPGLEFGLIEYATLKLSLRKILSLKLPARLTIKNPLQTDLRVLHVNFDIYHNKTKIGNVNEEVDIFVPKNKTSVTPEVYVKIVGVTFELLKKILGELHVDAVGSLKATIDGNFTLEVEYAQYDVPGKLILL